MKRAIAEDPSIEYGERRPTRTRTSPKHGSTRSTGSTTGPALASQETPRSPDRRRRRRALDVRTGSTDHRVLRTRRIYRRSSKCIVAVDPSWGTKGDECGIVVVALGKDLHAYVLADLSIRGTPDKWGTVVGEAFRDGAPFWPRRMDYVVAEKAFQGEQVRLVMQTIATKLNLTIPFRFTNSSVGKKLRAEPIVALDQARAASTTLAYSRSSKWQMTNWVPPDEVDESEDNEPKSERSLARSLDEDQAGAEDEAQPSTFSPDRIDARVFGVTELLLDDARLGALEVATGRIPGHETDSVDAHLARMPAHLRARTQAALRRG